MVTLSPVGETLMSRRDRVCGPVQRRDEGERRLEALRKAKEPTHRAAFNGIPVTVVSRYLQTRMRSEGSNGGAGFGTVGSSLYAPFATVLASWDCRAVGSPPCSLIQIEAPDV